MCVGNIGYWGVPAIELSSGTFGGIILVGVGGADWEKCRRPI